MIEYRKAGIFTLLFYKFTYFKEYKEMKSYGYEKVIEEAFVWLHFLSKRYPEYLYYLESSLEDVSGRKRPKIIIHIDRLSKGKNKKFRIYESNFNVLNMKVEKTKFVIDGKSIFEKAF